ncbi:hypothetical protein H5410_044736 [Solanum commersonii]|uniref:Uncharacterized protein n=1 Tax=Solanum commersonii TaxID=4109 RepID=A0A9J5XAJ6_SOLCO|nr:hypothetical protein H5410_044736 [Solanum commersonii]
MDENKDTVIVQERIADTNLRRCTRYAQMSPERKQLCLSHSKEATESNEQEIIQSVSSPTDTGRRRRHKGVDGAIARVISEMVVASRLSSPEVR